MRHAARIATAAIVTLLSAGWLGCGAGSGGAAGNGGRGGASAGMAGKGGGSDGAAAGASGATAGTSGGVDQGGAGGGTPTAGEGGNGGDPADTGQGGARGAMAGADGAGGAGGAKSGTGGATAGRGGGGAAGMRGLGGRGGSVGGGGRGGGAGLSGGAGGRGDAGTSGGGDAGTCDGTAPCGGSLAGTWSFTGYCINQASVMDQLMPACAGTTISDLVFRQSGSVTFADTSYTAGGTTWVSLTYTFPLSCVEDVSCGELADRLAGNADVESASCSGSTTCTCPIVYAPMTSTESGSYQTSGSTLTLMPTDGSASSKSYCVKGDVLHLLEIETITRMGSMIMRTTSDQTAMRQ